MNASSRPILIATDFSDPASEALRQAQQWAARRSAPLVLAHAVVDPTPMFAPMGEMQRFAAAIRDAKETCRVKLQEIADGMDGEVSVEVGVGASAEVILRLAQRHDASLVVVGASGRGAVEKVLLGTTADQVLRHATTDVLIARESPNGPVVAASDLSERGHPAIEVGVEAASDGPLHLLHALDIAHPVLVTFEPLLAVDDETRAELHTAAKRVLQANLERADREGEVVVREGRPERVVTSYVEEVSASLVTVATQGRTGLARLALGSVAAGVVRQAPCSVYVARSPELED